MKQYLRGSTPYFRVKVKDLDGALVTPTSVDVHVRHRQTNAVIQTTTAMSQEGTTTGVYYYAGWTVPDTTMDGIYDWTVVITDGAVITKQEGQFEIVSRGTTTT